MTTDTCLRTKLIADVEDARALLRYLHPTEKVIRVFSRSDDKPPCCFALFSDGTRIGVDVTDFVDEDLVVRYAQRKAELYGHDPLVVAAQGIRRLSLVEVAEQIRLILEKKDVDLGYKRGDGPYDRYIVLIHAAAPFVHLPLLQTAASLGEVKTKFIEEAYALIPYDPRVEKKFPGGRAVVPLRLKAAG